MAIIRLTSPTHFSTSPAREKLRARFKRLPKHAKPRAREEISREIQHEVFRRAYSSLGKSPREIREGEGKVRALKEKAVRGWLEDEIESGEIGEIEIDQYTTQATLIKVGSLAKKKARPKYVLAYTKKGKQMTRGRDRGGQKLPLYRIERWDPRKKKKVLSRKLYTTGQVRWRIGIEGYWSRVRSLRDALGLRSTREAQQLDRRMLEVPESLRRRIYEKVLRKYGVKRAS